MEYFCNTVTNYVDLAFKLYHLSFVICVLVLQVDRNVKICPFDIKVHPEVLFDVNVFFFSQKHLSAHFLLL